MLMNWTGYLKIQDALDFNCIENTHCPVRYDTGTYYALFHHR